MKESTIELPQLSEAHQPLLQQHDVSGSAFTIRNVNGRLGMSGSDIGFINEDFFGLEVGQKIVQIGDGRENGSFRTDSFKNPIEYSGSVICQFNDLEKMYAFNTFERTGNDTIYLLYGTTGLEIFTESVYSKKRKQSFVRFYSPVFLLADR